MRISRLVAALCALSTASALAGVDANLASQAELESVKGVGPSLSTLIVSERAKSPFKDWSDLRTRVKGIGEASAERFSKAGLTVDGKSYRQK